MTCYREVQNCTEMFSNGDSKASSDFSAFNQQLHKFKSNYRLQPLIIVLSSSFSSHSWEPQFVWSNVKSCWWSQTGLFLKTTRSLVSLWLTGPRMMLLSENANFKISVDKSVGDPISIFFPYSPWWGHASQKCITASIFSSPAPHAHIAGIPVNILLCITTPPLHRNSPSCVPFSAALGAIPAQTWYFRQHKWLKVTCKSSYWSIRNTENRD